MMKQQLNDVFHKYTPLSYANDKKENGGGCRDIESTHKKE